MSHHHCINSERPPCLPGSRQPTLRPGGEQAGGGKGEIEDREELVSLCSFLPSGQDIHGLETGQGENKERRNGHVCRQTEDKNIFTCPKWSIQMSHNRQRVYKNSVHIWGNGSPFYHITSANLDGVPN